VSARLPPGAAHVLRIETTGGRIIRLLATNWNDYEQWVKGLGLMMRKSPPSPEKGGAGILKVGRGGGMTRGGERQANAGVSLDFLDEVKRGSGTGNVLGENVFLGSPSRKSMSINSPSRSSTMRRKYNGTPVDRAKRRLSFTESVANRL
jgi:hypothetical protein